MTGIQRTDVVLNIFIIYIYFKTSQAKKLFEALMNKYQHLISILIYSGSFY